MDRPQTVLNIQGVSNEINKWNKQLYESRKVREDYIKKKGEIGNLYYFLYLYSILKKLRIWISKAENDLITEMDQEYNILEGKLKTWNKPEELNETSELSKGAISLLEEIRDSKGGFSGIFSVERRNDRILRRHAGRVAKHFRDMKKKIGIPKQKQIQEKKIISKAKEKKAI